MKEYSVPCTWENFGTMTIKANSLDEAISYAESDNAPFPDGDYIQGSFEVAHELIEEYDIMVEGVLPIWDIKHFFGKQRKGDETHIERFITKPDGRMGLGPWE